MVGLIAMPLAPERAHATPYWTTADWEAARAAGKSAAPAGPITLAPVPRGAASHIDYVALFADAAAFVATLQVTSGANLGGIREDEHLPNIIQTDNTSESIWLWTRYYQLTGDTTYFQNVRDSFTYSRNFPAYNEEGGSLPAMGYYRMYNCGWAAFAEWFFRSVTGDTTQKVYGDSCADYIATHNLNRQGTMFEQQVNPPVLAWAAGNLWIVGDAQGNAAWKDAAEARGLRVKGWVEGEPTLLSEETWAMSGGASMWGILNSWFEENPESTAIWTDARKDAMDDYALPLVDFNNAWNGWYALGHHAVWKAILYDAARVRALALADTLAAEDGDLDGGIPARPADSDTMDQTWVTSYLAFMALDPWIHATGVVGDGLAPVGPRAAIAAAPSPFAGETRVLVSLARPGPVSLTVHDVAGRRVRTLVDGALAARAYGIAWDGRDDLGAEASAGVYLLRIETPDGAGSAKVVRIR
jgi:hypothetical protein